MIAFNKNKVEKVGSRNSQILVKCFRCYNSEEILLKANKVDPSDIVKKYEDINYYRDLYDSWFAYKNENSYFTFEQLCEKNNKKFSWISAYYYE